MKQFIANTALFLFIFFIIDKGLILVRNTAPDREIDKRLEWILNGKIQADILIYGSSRGSRNIIASQIGDSVNRSAYNLSYQGAAIGFHEFLLEQLFAHANKKPELVLLVVDDPYELLNSERNNFRLDRLYPLVKYSVVRDKLVEAGDKNYWLSRLFIVHQLSISNFDFRQRHFSRLDTMLNDGSMPISFTDPRFNGVFSKNTASYDAAKENASQVESFLRFIELCNRNHVKLLIVSPPNFYNPTPGFNTRLKQLAGNRAGFMMYDTLHRTFASLPGYYYDDVHLKRNGAVLFTNEIIRYIKENKILSQPLAKK